MRFLKFPLPIAINLICLLMLSFAQERIPELTLAWVHRDENTVFTFRKVQRVRDVLKFEIEAHNRHRDHYMCFYVNSGERSVHIDDDSGLDYRGQAIVAIQNNSDNKLALNQRKTFTISIPAPRREASSVNLHLGLYARGVEHRHDCYTPLQEEVRYNFHQLDWDVSSLR